MSLAPHDTAWVALCTLGEWQYEELEIVHVKQWYCKGEVWGQAWTKDTPLPIQFIWW